MTLDQRAGGRQALRRPETAGAHDLIGAVKRRLLAVSRLPPLDSRREIAAWPDYARTIMTDLLGINHVTLSTTGLDQLVAYYTELLGATLAFERAATAADPRIAVLDVGGADHLMIVETAALPALDLDPLNRAGWGLRVGTYAQLRRLRERILEAGHPVGQVETLPTQWTMTARDPDGRAVDIRAHRPR